MSDERQPEGVVRRRPRQIRVAEAREGYHGDWGVTVWLPTQAEAEAFVRMANDRFRKPKAEADETRIEAP
jgi:hypothetical protein